MDSYNQVFQSQQNIYNALINNLKGKTKSQIKTLGQIILPKVALYKAFIENNFSKEISLEYIQKYMFEVGKKTNKLYKILEYLPFAEKLFLNVVKNQMTTKDNWRTEIITVEPNKIEINILKCLWYDACFENNCLELCKCFCDVDNIIYKDMKKIIFERTGTLFYGNKCCDFTFKRRME